MDDADWDDLIDLIREGTVVPVVGPELLVVPGENGDELHLEARWAAETAQALGVGAPPKPRIRDVANEFLAREGLKRRDRLRLRLSEVMRAEKRAPPALEALALISHFRLFVPVTADGLLERAVKRRRLRAEAETLLIANEPRSRKQDLPAELSELNVTTVFYPFGCVTKANYAITEEDTLEFLFDMLESRSRCQNLFATLKNANLLLLGCNYPDWLTRVWIRALIGERIQTMDRNTMELVADRAAHDDANLVMFLKRTKVQIFAEGGANEFVAKLVSRYLARVAAAPTVADTTVRDAHVFISFASEDRTAAEAVCARFGAFGIEAWYDKDDVFAGEHLVDQLRRAIDRVHVFVPLLSTTAAARREGHFRKEWERAVERAKGVGDADPFIYPVALDDVRPEADMPRLIAEAAWERARDGDVSDAFILRIRDVIRRAQTK